MLFNSYSFIFAYLPLTFISYRIFVRFNYRYGIIFLGLASLFFYALWDIYSLPVLLLSIILNYFAGSFLAKDNSKNLNFKLFIFIALNLCVLFHYKYFNFIMENITLHLNIELPFQLRESKLPLGISFFTFTQISFLIECRDNNPKKYKFFDYLLFVSLFPHLIAGPLLHFKEMSKQFNEKIAFVNWENIYLGIILFVLGLGKKVLLADELAKYVAGGFGTIGSEPSGLIFSWLTALAYTFQLYFDFSGYSDMAVGLGLLFGLKLPFNFDSPFKARSIIDFWQRWHKSLTRYIGEYLYAPWTLSAMRSTINANEIKKYFFTLFIPTIFVFIIVGIWHGANWTFALFGLLNGIALVINHTYRKYIFSNQNFLSIDMISSFLNIVYWAFTFIFVVIAFVIFRSESIHHSMVFINNLFQNPVIFSKEISLNLIKYHINLISIICISMAVAFYMPNTISISNDSSGKYVNSQGIRSLFFLIFIAMVFILSLIKLNNPTTFLYYQF